MSDGMDILWPALGIALIVVFVFFVLAQHWRRLLQQQSRAIRQLAQRLQNLEDMADPELRRRLGDAAPVPLEQVYTFTLRLGERFWRDTVGATEADRKFIHEYGSFLASVKLERWRSHTVATVSEILPARKAAGLQTRTLDFYPNASKRDDALLLWELVISRPDAPGLRPRSVELLLRPDALELRGPLGRVPPTNFGNGHAASQRVDEPDVLLHLNLQADGLSEYRCSDPETFGEGARADRGAANGTGSSHRANGDSFWQASYAGSDDERGIEWELRLRDLSKKSEWERWRIWEAGAVPAGRG